MLTIKNDLKIYLNSMMNTFRIDERGAFLLSFELKLKDQEFLKYCHLDMDL